MTKWKTVKLGDVAEVQTGPFGSQLHQKDYVENGTPIITVEHLGQRQISCQNLPRVSDDDTDRLKKYVLSTGDIVFSRVGSVDRTSLVQQAENGWLFSGRCLRVRVKPEHYVHPFFLYYYFCQDELKENIRRIAVGATMPSINTSILSDVSISFPSPEEQRRIASILGCFDAKIELNRRMNANLESQAAAIFKSWFVDFEPFKKKKFVDSPLGMIPNGWRAGTIDEIASINKWTLSQKDELDSIDYIEISEVMRGVVGNIVNYQRGEEPSRAKRRLKHGDTIISTVRPDRGAYLLVLHPKPSLIASTGFAVLTPTNDFWAFLHAATTRLEFGQELGHLADGGAYPAIRPEVIGYRPIALPDNVELIAKFDAITQPLYECIYHNQAESRTLATIRDTLLPKLMRGEV